MKISVSLSEKDVAVLDEYARTSGVGTRSAAVQHAVRLLRHPHLGDQYEAAWKEWEESEDAALWDSTVGDGLLDAPR
ncbi:MAG: ribbon-helix-helix domain-containing protein [Solirubrobacteraceae bacterium]